ncbi:Fur family transcriptional regulator [Clostridiaceae bacterium]|jgi:Fur family peroxide stress response transcriptional regulator|uniref:Fur family transcriptional regulator n=1 Tax=Luoshenia tenuis TaxID=2763654 RepID=UPI0011C9B776
MKKRNTIQRQLVLQAVIDHGMHPTADEVYDKVKAIYPDISRATVYRNLNILAEEGKLRRIAVPDAADRFDQTCSDHYHIKCTVCGAFKDIDLPYLEQLDETVAKMTEYEMESHDIVFMGTCPQCQEAKRTGSD